MTLATLYCSLLLSIFSKLSASKQSLPYYLLLSTVSLPSIYGFSTFHLQTQMSDESQHGFSCPTNPPLSVTDRTEFGERGCLIYGYPSSGGVLIKEANLLDMLFLSLARSQASHRASSPDEEDTFCNLMRRTGATLWPSKEDWIDVELGIRDATEEEKKVVVFGWPMDGVGVWVLRFTSARQLPRDFGRIAFAMNMEEKIRIMKEYGATFVEDVTQVDELKIEKA